MQVLAEQGFGDVLQFCRYVPVLAQLGFRVRLKAHQALHTLLSSLKGVDTIVLPDAASDPDVMMSVPMMSLPLLLGMPAGSIPCHFP